jgi:hypothetical protein
MFDVGYLDVESFIRTAVDCTASTGSPSIGRAANTDLRVRSVRRTRPIQGDGATARIPVPATAFEAEAPGQRQIHGYRAHEATTLA